MRVWLIPALALAAPALAQDHSGMDHGMMDHSAMGHDMPADQPVAEDPPPPAPTDWAADAVYGTASMARARAHLFAGTRDMTSHMVLIDRLEWQGRRGRDSLAWSARAFYGGDLDRLVIRTEGEAARGERAESAEVRALWSHAVGPFANMELGLRQDLQAGPRRTYATLGLDAMLPWWIESETALFLSHKGELLARAELSHDMRLTQSLILQPRAELDVSGQSMPAMRIGDGLTGLELGLRLRWAKEPRLAPYLGVDWHRKVGATARYARAAGDHASSTSVVAGVRFWF